VADLTLTAKVAVDGTATARIRPPSQRPWIIAQVAIELQNAPSGATCALRKNGYPVSAMIPTMDTAAGEPYIRLLPTDELTVNWAGCTPNAIGKVQVFYTEG
jgi:hypothetical protein